MRSEKVSGIVLRRTNIGEADKLVTLFTREKGKIVVLAKGIRRLKSRRAPHLELFNFVQISLSATKRYPIVTEAKVRENYSEIKNDLRLSAFAFYLAEVLDRLLPENEPHVFVLDQLYSTLEQLSQREKTSSERVVKKFVIQLLWNLGYLPKGEYPKNSVTDFVEEIAERRIRSKTFLEEL